MSNVTKLERRRAWNFDSSESDATRKALENTCDALEYSLRRLTYLDPTDPLIRKVIVTLEAGRVMLAKPEGPTP